MILPIRAYGNAVLRKRTQDVKKGHPELSELIANMFETMYAAAGVGLAAPQIGQSLNLFVMDVSAYEDEYPEAAGFKKLLINPKITKEFGDEWAFCEGCLSIPEIREDIIRKPDIIIRYQDENFDWHEEEYSGMIARVIQHEYDHLENKLFIDRIKPLRKMMIKGRLNDIEKGNITMNYRMKFNITRSRR